MTGWRSACILAVYFGSSFVLHFLWEMWQRPLFAPPPASLIEHIPMCLLATATGDMAFMLTLYLTAAVIHRDALWIGAAASYRHPATWSVTTLVGVLLAISFELWAVHAVDRWQYGPMPVVPVLRVGLTPLLQMVIVPALVLALCGWLVHRASRGVNPPK